MPRVNVIVPAFDAAAYLDETIASVVSQSLHDWELTVVDNGSTDGTGAIADEWSRRDPRVSVLRLPANRGAAGGRNAGFAAAARATDHVLFLDADDCLEPTALETMACCLDGHPDVGMVHCGYSLVDDQGRALESDGAWTPRWVPSGGWIRKLGPDDPDTPFVSVFCLAAIVPSMALFRCSAYCLTPGWDEEFGQGFEDTNLFLHVALVSKIRYVPGPLVRRRLHGGQMTADLEKLGSQERKLYERWRNPAGLTERQSRTVRSAWRFRERRLIPAQAIEAAGRYAREGKLLLALRFLAGAARSWLASHLRELRGAEAPQ
jgi:glycosyltransferase involved in cell wall biosynthesis